MVELLPVIALLWSVRFISFNFYGHIEQAVDPEDSFVFESVAQSYLMDGEFLLRFFELMDANGFETLIFQFVENFLFHDCS